jgi:predicted phosphodiesterase
MTEEERKALEEIENSREAELEGKLAAARRERDALKRQLGRLEEEKTELETALDIVKDIETHTPTPPEWLAPEPSGKHRGTPVLLLTDTHFDEIVTPEEVMGLNSYNREIAEVRLKKAFEGAVLLPNHWLGSNLIKEGIVLAFGGDLITGEIHDELTSTNEATIPETIEYWLDPMIAGIKLLREEYGKVHVVVVDGNHDRFYKKKRSKKAARGSFSWLFWKQVARYFKYTRSSNVSFQIPDSRDTIFPVYDTRVLLHHGDQFRGGSGISGVVSPLHIGDYRKRRKHASAETYTGRKDLRFDIQLMGHFHHRNSLPGIITGGCLKGYDEYAMTGNFPFDEASQELLIFTPERGLTFQAPIYVQDREAEGW